MKEKKLRKEIIKSKIAKLIDSLEFVEESLPKDFEEFKLSRITKNALYKEIEFSIELILDIIAIINSDLKLGIPEVEENIINNIEKNKLLSKEIINIIKEMKGFRNLLVHKYGEINDNLAYESIKEGLKDFDLIINEIESLLKKYNK